MFVLVMSQQPLADVARSFAMRSAHRLQTAVNCVAASLLIGGACIGLSISTASSEQMRGSALGGETILIDAGRDGRVAASSVSSTDDLAVKAVRDVTRAATVQGKDIDLSAHTLDLGAQETHASHTSRDQSSGWTAGVTYHGGMAFSYDASINMSEGRAEGQSTQQHNTHIRATEGVRFASTGDTSLKGARIDADTVKGRVGRNLTIESLQDTAESSAEQNSSGLNFSYGAQGTSNAGTNAGINFSQGNASGSYAVVTEQSGIAAETGGFDIEVAGTTHLKGA